MRTQPRTAALLFAALAAVPAATGFFFTPLAAQSNEDRTDSTEYTESRADYWEARAAYAARRAATEARKEAGLSEEEAEALGIDYLAAPREDGAYEGEAAPAYFDGVPTNGQLAALRWCESSDDYTANTGNGYYGAYQFSPITWWWLGYSGYPHHASPAVQDEAARYLYSIFGWSPWPACSWLLGFA